jgi:hypothetical protein
VAIVVSLSYVRNLRAYRATQTIRVLEDDLRAAQNRELSKTDQKLGVLTCTIETGMGSNDIPAPSTADDRFEELNVYRQIPTRLEFDQCW